jgi:hypothetical protein
VNRPRAIGTYAETAVARTAQTNGFPNADRFALHGSRDIGDVGLCPGVIVEVKGGHAAHHATDLDVQNWLDETARERDNANAAVGFLVVQREHVGAPNAHRWWAYWRLGWISDLSYTQAFISARHTVVRMTLGGALDLLRAAGYGDPLDRWGDP